MHPALRTTEVWLRPSAHACIIAATGEIAIGDTLPRPGSLAPRRFPRTGTDPLNGSSYLDLSNNARRLDLGR